MDLKNSAARFPISSGLNSSLFGMSGAIGGRQIVVRCVNHPIFQFYIPLGASAKVLKRPTIMQLLMRAAVKGRQILNQSEVH